MFSFTRAVALAFVAVLLLHATSATTASTTTPPDYGDYLPASSLLEEESEFTRTSGSSSDSTTNSPFQTMLTFTPPGARPKDAVGEIFSFTGSLTVPTAQPWLKVTGTMYGTVMRSDGNLNMFGTVAFGLSVDLVCVTVEATVRGNVFAGSRDIHEPLRLLQVAVREMIERRTAQVSRSIADTIGTSPLWAVNGAKAFPLEQYEMMRGSVRDLMRAAAAGNWKAEGAVQASAGAGMLERSLQAASNLMRSDVHDAATTILRRLRSFDRTIEGMFRQFELLVAGAVADLKLDDPATGQASFTVRRKTADEARTATREAFATMADLVKARVFSDWIAATEKLLALLEAPGVTAASLRGDAATRARLEEAARALACTAFRRPLATCAAAPWSDASTTPLISAEERRNDLQPWLRGIMGEARDLLAQRLTFAPRASADAATAATLAAASASSAKLAPLPDCKVSISYSVEFSLAVTGHVPMPKLTSVKVGKGEAAPASVTVVLSHTPWGRSVHMNLNNPNDPSSYAAKFKGYLGLVFTHAGDVTADAAVIFRVFEANPTKAEMLYFGTVRYSFDASGGGSARALMQNSLVANLALNLGSAFGLSLRSVGEAALATPAAANGASSLEAIGAVANTFAKSLVDLCTAEPARASAIAATATGLLALSTPSMSAAATSGLAASPIGMKLDIGAMYWGYRQYNDFDARGIRPRATPITYQTSWTFAQSRWTYDSSSPLGKLGLSASAEASQGMLYMNFDVSDEKQERTGKASTSTAKNGKAGTTSTAAKSK